MKKNIAIIIGVSEYQNLNNLPGCNNDFNLISKIIRTTEKYDDVLEINSNTLSLDVKEKLSAFINNKKNDDIDELFFYYSGHGYYDGDDLLYILTDYVNERINSTSISNSFIDNLFRELNPKLLVKVVDACNSGIQYIKGIENIPNIFEEKKDLNNCYFMFSSHSNQSSYVNNLSHFTKSFSKSILEHSGQNISYSNIIDYIKDSFIDNSLQVPYFITQGSLTENFCSISEKIRAIDINLFEENSNDIKETRSLTDIIKESSKKYVSKNQVDDILTEIKKEISDKVKEWNLGELFEAIISTRQNYSDVHGIKEVAKWVNDNKNDYFVKVKKVEVKSVKTYNAFSTLTSNLGNLYSTYRPDSIYSNLDVEFDTISIMAEPKFNNLKKYECNIILLISRYNIKVFYNFVSYKETGWDVYSANKISNWKTFSFEYLNWVNNRINVSDIVVEFCGYITEKLETMFNGHTSE